jgi:hypothetical protein
MAGGGGTCNAITLDGGGQFTVIALGWAGCSGW